MAGEVEQIKERLSITEVVGAYVKLEKAGSSYRARCPFHSEKTPSFFVSPARGSYYCFGCGAKGDIFTFVQAFEGLDFMGALKLLGEKAGVSILSHSDPNADEERAKLFAVHEWAAGWYEECFQKEPRAAAYLHERGVSDQSIRHFRIGYALSEWRALYGYLHGKGYSDALLARSGLVKETPKGCYDRFRGRIMFPLFDSSGRVIAFSGRLFDHPAPTETAATGEKTEAPKYVNSPETLLFSKSRVLYGFDKAKNSIRKHDFSIVVEGQMDLVLSHQAGFSNTVALSGTALTILQLSMLARLSQNVVFAFDADRAGVLSSGKSAELALKEGMNVKLSAMPAGVDPADLISKNPDDWRKVIREAEHIVEYYLTVLAAETKDLRMLRLKVQSAVLPFIANIPNKIDQAHFVSRVASRLNLADTPVWEELEKLSHIRAPSVPETEERAARVPPPYLPRRELIVRKILGILLWQEGTAHPAIDTVALRARLKETLGDSASEQIASVEDFGKKEAFIFEAEGAYENPEQISLEVEDLLQHLTLEKARQELTSATEALRFAETKHDEAGIAEALQNVKRLSAGVSRLTTK